MNKAAVKHPFAASVAVVLIFAASMFLGSAVLFVSPTAIIEGGEFVQQSVAESVVALVGIALVSVFGYTAIWSRTENFGKGLACSGYIIFTSCVAALSGLALKLSEFSDDSGIIEFPEAQPLWKFIVFLVMGFLIGIAEESFFRGVVANLFWDKHAKDPAGVWTATIYSGLIFGLMHTLNILSSNPVGVFVQIIAATAMGMAFTAIYYRCKNIWVVIFLHAFLDICALLPEGIFGGSLSEEIGSYSPVMAITSSLPYLVLTCFLLRKTKMVEMFTGAANLGALPYIQTPNGPMAARYEVSSSEKSRASMARAATIAIIVSEKSRASMARAAAIAITVAVMLFAGALYLNGDLRKMTSYEPTLDYTHSVKWNGERTMGHETVFEVEQSGNYTVEITTMPSVYNAYVLIQLKRGDEIVFQENYGGRNDTDFDIQLERGEYSLILVYNCTEITDPDAELYTEVVIK